MMIAIPSPADYGLSRTRAFLPDDLPPARLPDPYYSKWEDVASNLQALILCRRIRAVVDRLPILSTAGLEREAEWRRAYSLLCFVAHAYIWGGDSPSDRLPGSISVPLQEVADRLEVPPVATYAALCLWNFRTIFADEDVDDLENLATLNTFTGSIDESWFYLVSIAIEARGARVVPLMLTAIRAAAQLGGHADTSLGPAAGAAGTATAVAAAAAVAVASATVTRCLHAFAESLVELTAILQRMHENCDPSMFYNRIRPFLAGSRNMAEAGLPHGVIYEDAAGGCGGGGGLCGGGGGRGGHRQYSGGSNGQSSLIQFFDIVLGIEHRPTGEKPRHPHAHAHPPHRQHGSAPAPTNNFIREMHRYMPGPHARFLADVAAVANIRQFVEANPLDQTLSLAYDGCLAALSAFRDKHIAIVTRYIIMPARSGQGRSNSPNRLRQRVNLAAPSPWGGPQQQPHQQQQARADKFKGTGGTWLLPFLKQARDETGEPAVYAFTRRLMSNHHKAEAKKDAALDLSDTRAAVEEEVKVAGLAGSWSVDDNPGGICGY